MLTTEERKQRKKARRKVYMASPEGKAATRVWREKNKVRLNDYQRAYIAKVRAEKPEHWRALRDGINQRYCTRRPERVKAAKAAWAKKHPGYLAEYYQSAKTADCRVYILQASRARAKRRGFACTIGLADIVLPEFCPVLGLKLAVGKDRVQRNSPSLDRFDLSKGYIPGNVRVISHRANALKNDGTLKEMRLVVEYMEGKR